MKQPKKTEQKMNRALAERREKAKERRQKQKFNK